jgi:toxin ParE1/3/4
LGIVFWSLLTRHSPCWPPSPRWGWYFRLEHPSLKSLRVFRVSGFEKILVLYLPVESGVEIVRVIHGSRNLLTILRA